MSNTDYYVTVCAACSCASCWHMEFPCGNYLHADTKRMKASELSELNAENADHYSRAKILEVCGTVEEVAE